MHRIKAFGLVTFSSLKIRNFRLFFIDQSLAQSGMWMQAVALGWAVLQITGSGTKLGIVVALQFLPMLLLGPWGGLISDRYDKRKILFITQISFGILILFVSILLFSGIESMAVLYFYAITFGIIRLFDNLARQTFVSELVDSSNLKNAVSLNATVNNLARAVGPSIAGILIASISTAFCFFFIAFVYLSAIIALSRIDKAVSLPPKSEKKIMSELMEGFRYVMATPLIRNTLIMMAIVGTFAFEFQVSLPILAEDTFNGDAKSYALLMTSMGIGAVVGGLFAAGRHKIAIHHLTSFMLLFGLSIMFVVAMPTLNLASFGMLLVGFFSINLTSLANTMIQLESAIHMRGRVMALFCMAMAGSTPIGGPIVGYVAEIFGGRAGIAIGGIAALLVASYGLIVVSKNKKVIEKSISAEIETSGGEVSVSLK